MHVCPTRPSAAFGGRQAAILAPQGAAGCGVAGSQAGCGARALKRGRPSAVAAKGFWRIPSEGEEGGRSASPGRGAGRTRPAGGATG